MSAMSAYIPQLLIADIHDLNNTVVDGLPACQNVGIYPHPPLVPDILDLPI